MTYVMQLLRWEMPVKGTFLRGIPKTSPNGGQRMAAKAGNII